MDNDVSDEVRRLLAGGITSMDHVDLLFHLARGELTRAELALVTRFDEPLVNVLVDNMERAGLVESRGATVRLTDSTHDRNAIGELLKIYNARPVTLVRAIYARDLLTRAVTEAITPRHGDE